MNASRTVSNTDDTIDSRDVIARIEELRELALTCPQCGEVVHDKPKGYKLARCWNGEGHTDGGTLAFDCPLEDEEGEELDALLALAAEASDYAADWEHGEALIRDSYFTEYAQQLADDIGAIPEGNRWPAYCIDWERAARELQMDYSAVEFDGVTYWIR